MRERIVFVLRLARRVLFTRKNSGLLPLVELGPLLRTRHREIIFFADFFIQLLRIHLSLFNFFHLLLQFALLLLNFLLHQVSLLIQLLFLHFNLFDALHFIFDFFLELFSLIVFHAQDPFNILLPVDFTNGLYLFLLFQHLVLHLLHSRDILLLFGKLLLVQL